MAETRKVEGVSEAPVRGTQSLVQTLGRCWKRPALTGLEVLWRWAFGVPALAVAGWYGRRILAAHTAGTFDVGRLGLDRALVSDPVGAAAADPLGVTAKVSHAVGLVRPDVVQVALWLGPLLLVAWVVVSSVGRTVVLRRMDARLHGRVGTLMGLQAIRTVALVGIFAAWFGCLRWAAEVAVNRVAAAGGEPNLVLYFALSIVSTLGLFVLWAGVSWVFSVAPLLAMLRDMGVGRSLSAAFRLGVVRSKLVEVNLVLGIVKIALVVLAIVFSATPVPFSGVTTPEFLAWWWTGVAVLYLLGSDFFHVARLMGYLELWRAYAGQEDSLAR